MIDAVGVEGSYHDGAHFIPEVGVNIRDEGQQVMFEDVFYFIVFELQGSNIFAKLHGDFFYEGEVLGIVEVFEVVYFEVTVVYPSYDRLFFEEMTQISDTDLS